MLLRGYMHTAILCGDLGRGDIIDRVMVGSGTPCASLSLPLMQKDSAVTADELAISLRSLLAAPTLASRHSLGGLYASGWPRGGDANLQRGVQNAC
jgi:hypothetical protein